MTWFEAPLVDTDLEGYRELRRQTAVPILPAGNTILDLASIALGIELGAWSSVRVDATIAGGITPTRKVMALAEAHGMNCELQCWGYTLTQAANLHLMLACANCSYFEQPVPYPAFEAGSLDTIRTDAEGYVHAPSGDGLGIRVDWRAIEAASFISYELAKALQGHPMRGKGAAMKITGIDCHVLFAPNFDKALTSSAQDSFIVALHTDEGITGFGESDVNPWIAKSCIEAPGHAHHEPLIA